jgi:hypothetical protein
MLSKFPPSPNASSNAFIVSSTDTVAPALNPNNALTPLSLNNISS